MADDQITVYKGDRTIQVSKAALQEAKTKGWSATPPAKGLPAQAPAQGQKPFTEPGFVAGFGAGINPFHQTPGNMPVPGTMGPVSRGAADMVNMREIFNRATTGDVKGAVGQGMGTMAGLLGPSELGGVMKGAGAAARAAEEIPMLARAGKYATETAKALRVSPEAARFAERYVMPLRESMDALFEPIHQALSKQIIPLSPAAQQLIRRLTKSEIPSVYKIGEELSRRTAMDYREAEGLRRELMSMAQGAAEHWSPQIRALANEIDKEIQKEAGKAGVGSSRAEMRAISKQIEEVKTAAATTAKTKSPTIRGAAAAGVGKVGGQAGEGVAASIRAGQETTMKASPVVEAQAKRLAKKLGVNPKRLGTATSTLERAGTATKAAGVGARVAAGARGMEGALQQPNQ